MTKYPIHDTSQGAHDGEIVQGIFTHNPIPEGTILNILYKNMKVLIKIDVNFYSDPNLSIIKILEITHD